MRCGLFAFLLLAGAACAQPNGILLVAKPGMIDPNFRQAVVAVARAEDGSTVGVILNRPTASRLAEIAPDLENAGRFADPVSIGGPVMKQVIVAMFVADHEPEERAFQLVPNVYLTLHPRIIERLLAGPGGKVRLFAGFAGWAPRQLEAEMAEGTWYALRATESLLFRQDTSGLWRELVDQASGGRAANDDAASALAAILGP